MLLSLCPEKSLCSALEAGAGGGDGGVEVCKCDNRGAGQSSMPANKSKYTWVRSMHTVSFLVRLSVCCFVEFLESGGIHRRIWLIAWKCKRSNLAMNFSAVMLILSSHLLYSHNYEMLYSCIVILITTSTLFQLATLDPLKYIVRLLKCLASLEMPCLATWSICIVRSFQMYGYWPYKWNYQLSVFLLLCLAGRFEGWTSSRTNK